MSLTITHHSGKWNPLFRALETALVPSHACRDTLFRRCSAHRTLLRCSEPSFHCRKETLARHSIAVDCALSFILMTCCQPHATFLPWHVVRSWWESFILAPGECCLFGNHWQGVMESNHRCRSQIPVPYLLANPL